MNTNLLTKLLLASAGLALFSSAAHAQSTIHAHSDDLFLSFRVTDGLGTGANQNLEVDLGSATSLSSSTNISLALGSDLSAIYGSNWYTRTDLVWNISASDPNTFTLWSTVPKGVTPDSPGSSGTQQLPAGNIDTMKGALNLKTSYSALGNDQNVSNSANNSYYQLSTENGSVGTPFGFFRSFGATENSAYLDASATSGASVSSVIYEFDAGSSSPAYQVAVAKLSDNGTFTAVPEPSTYAMVGLGLAFLFFVKRRRKIAHA